MQELNVLPHYISDKGHEDVLKRNINQIRVTKNLGSAEVQCVYSNLIKAVKATCLNTQINRGRPNVWECVLKGEKEMLFMAC